ncbi:MAG: hypothetical protein ACNI27_08470 [Desulfovibrio sp.]
MTTKKKTQDVVILTPIMFEGEIVPKNKKITAPIAVAKDLIRRGRAALPESKETEKTDKKSGNKK